MNATEEEWKAKVAEDDDTFMPQLSDLADFRFRSELFRLTGTDKILLSDPYWNTKLIRFMLDDYERQLDEQEANLREVERKRIKKLRMAGFITETDDSAPSCRVHIDQSRHEKLTVTGERWAKRWKRRSKKQKKEKRKKKENKARKKKK